MAVEMAARAGAKLLWFPTCDGAYEQAHTFTGDPNKKLPFWAGIVLAMKEEGISAPPISILDEDGQLTEATHKVLDIIAKYNMILTTGHISHEETFALVKAAAEEHNVKNIIITHVDFPTTYYTVEDQKNWQTTVPTWSIATPRTPPKGGLRYHSGNDSGHGAGACCSLYRPWPAHRALSG